MSFVNGIPLYEEAGVDECWRRTGKAPTSTKWVDVAKGSDVRSRWVARDFKPKGETGRADLFAAMPPWRPSGCSSAGTRRRGTSRASRR